MIAASIADGAPRASLADLPSNSAAAAVWMAERLGWHPFPVAADKKPFAGTHGCLDATNDVERVNELFAAHPNANVAVATGIASGFFVVDVDVKNGVGWTGFQAFQQKHGTLPETLTIDTPSGGKHFLFKYPDNRTIGNPGVLKEFHIDIRGQGGYIVAPPSTLRTGGRYRISHDVPIARAPEWLLELIGKKTRVPVKAAAPSVTNGISEGGRNSMLCSIAGTLRRRGANEQAIIGALHSFNEAQCEPPLDASEVERIGHSVARYAPEVRHPETDVGNARRLVDAMEEKARYDHASRSWSIFDGRHWRRDDDGAVIRIAKSEGDRILAEAQAINDPDHRKRRIAFALKSQSSPRVRAMIELAQSEPGIPINADAFDRHPYLLNVRNGTIDLRSGELRGHSREDLISRVIDIDFAADAACPHWERFVSEVFEKNAELIEFVHRMIGYWATGETREQLLTILYGDGANGKSTLLNAVSNVLGPHAMHTPTETLTVRGGGQSNDLARLRGARLVTASEADSQQRLNEGLIKQVTGDEPITARYLYGEFFTFQPVFKLALATNALPAVNGSDPALFRRLRLIPFNRVFSAAEQDKGLGAKLNSELPGILAWIVRGAVKWYANGLTTPAAVLHAGAEFRADSDSVGAYCPSSEHLAQLAA
jgi:putative DNA primase/helicase